MGIVLHTTSAFVHYRSHFPWKTSLWGQKSYF